MESGLAKPSVSKGFVCDSKLAPYANASLLTEASGVSHECGLVLQSWAGPGAERAGRAGAAQEAEHKGRKVARRAERPGAGCTSSGAAVWHIYGCLDGWSGNEEEAHVQLHDRTAAWLTKLLYIFLCCCLALRNTHDPCWWLGISHAQN